MVQTAIIDCTKGIGYRVEVEYRSYREEVQTDTRLHVVDECDSFNYLTAVSRSISIFVKGHIASSTGEINLSKFEDIKWDAY